MAESVVKLKCGVKNDGWGKPGKEGLAAQLWSKTEGNGPIEEGKPYSEMWMGTYPSNPSYLVSTGESLEDYIKKNPQLVGNVASSRYGAELPFLPKILSFCKALTLQVHPDKGLAERLHQKDPSKFGDANHKPEIAVALSTFELFVGWKPLPHIQELFKLKPLQSYTPQYSHFNNGTLKQLCSTLLSASPEAVKKTVEELQNIPENQFGSYPYIPSMLGRLSKQYSEFDNGNLVATLLMNYMKIAPGEAVCVPADGIHAYLHGDIFECMARSDNVLNTGFCPRADRDSLELFSQALTFNPHSADEAKLLPKKSSRGTNGKTEEYAPPISEFNVLVTHLSGGEKESHRAINGPSLMIVTDGSGKVEGAGKSINLHHGDVFLVGAGPGLDFSTETGMDVYRAYAE